MQRQILVAVEEAFEAHQRSNEESNVWRSVTVQLVRGVNSVRGPDSSLGGVPVGYCPDDGHMEEEVQLKVQVEEDRRNIRKETR